MKTNKKEFIEPSLIKKGSNNLGLGMLKAPPSVDCRVIAEDGYQQLKKAFDIHDALLNFVKEMSRRYPNSPWIYKEADQLIKKATK